MADNDLPSKLTNPSTVQGLNPIDRNTSSEAGKRPFADYMNEGPQAKQAQSPTPMQALAPQTAPGGPPTMDSVQQQMKATSTQLGDLNQKLNTPNLKLKPSQKFLLRSKLEDAHTNIRESAQKVGVDTGPVPDLKKEQNPIAKFIALIGDGQEQLESAQNIIQKNSANGEMVNPADLLLAQIKLNRAQQQLDFSSIVLSKAIEGLKNLFNTQI
ncbi:MAG: hypothetical protein FJZ60_02715 [Chlamydiae bacterium]|nr:hypothetical protein [Chlamydiota bacterium]